MDSTDLELKKVNEEAFSKALAVAAVDFADPDDEVSGTSLSGGQQARLALARAMYKALVEKDVCACVLDDVTAALDPQVNFRKSKQMFVVKEVFKVLSSFLFEPGFISTVIVTVIPSFRCLISVLPFYI